MITPIVPGDAAGFAAWAAYRPASTGAVQCPPHSA